MPSTTILEIAPEEQAQMRAVLRRTRYGYLLAFHVLLLGAAGRTPTESMAFPLCSRSSVYRTCARIAPGASAYVSIKTVSSPWLCRRRS
jgi:hypothetical protein